MSLNINGSLSVQGELVSSLPDKKPLDLNGHMSNVAVLSASSEELEPKELTGYLSIPERIGETYKGSYEVIPSADFQLLPTADCTLSDDVLIHPIPYSEVSNEQGGITVTIGE